MVDIGQKYDRIAGWWHENHKDSAYGVAQINRAIGYCRNRGSALDVGCGSGGRIFRLLEGHGFRISGIDASAEMIRLAGTHHPNARLEVADIRTWNSDRTYDLIIAWDSIFHLLEHEQETVIRKLHGLLAKDGILIYSLGDAVGNHQAEWHGDNFPYGSIGIQNNLRLLIHLGSQIRHVELDQYPQRHAFIISQAGREADSV